MATTNIKLDIENITGIGSGNADAQFIISSQKSIVASIPKDLLTFAQKASSASTDGSAISFSVNDSIIDVQRNGFSCQEILPSDAIWALDSTSLKYATAKYPRWYHKQGAIHFAPVTDGSNAGYIFYVDYSLIDDDCDLRKAVIYYASASEFTKLSTDLVPSWTSPALPVAPISPDFGSDLTISSSAPAKPVIVKASVDTSGWTEPAYTKPTIVLSPAPTISNLSISTIAPVAPALTDTTVTETSITEPSFIPPVMSAPDFSDTNTWISTEEDSEMLAARVQEIQTKIGEYSARIAEAQAKFNQENVIFQKDIQIAIQNAQLESAEDGAKLQKFGAEVQQYQANVASEVQEYQQNLAADIQVWQSERTTDLQKYGTDIQNEQAEFNKELQIYQAAVQASIQDAQLDSAEDAQNLQKYGAELQEYQNEINKEIQDFTNTLGKEVQEYQSKVAKYGAELQSYQAEIAEQSAEKTMIQQNILYYAQQSDKYYKWAQMEVTQYIQNNSKMINKTMAAQAAQQRR